MTLRQRTHWFALHGVIRALRLGAQTRRTAGQAHRRPDGAGRPGGFADELRGARAGWCAAAPRG